MNLYRKIIAGNPYVDDETSGFYPMAVAETLPEGYEDADTIVNWHNYFTVSEIPADYMLVCDSIKRLHNATTWAALTAEEKSICCQYYAGSHADMIALVGVDNMVLYHVAHVAAVAEARAARMAYAVSEVRVRLPNNYQEVIDDIVDNQGVFSKHKNFGRKGTGAGEPEGIVDYLDSTGSFSANGLSGKGWTPEGMADMSELVAKLKTILVDGIY